MQPPTWHAFPKWKWRWVLQNKKLNWSSEKKLYCKCPLNFWKICPIIVLQKSYYKQGFTSAAIYFFSMAVCCHPFLCHNKWDPQKQHPLQSKSWTVQTSSGFETMAESVPCSFYSGRLGSVKVGSIMVWGNTPECWVKITVPLSIITEVEILLQYPT
jgi:hypothetical protein